ncbi:hypothetical protein Pcinc_012400 [Petrolisthes cinctipes]|uniref:Regulatory protein zeste n=1 Tax=Petrolisthes cinctipes TaxID=88211 RepID=A0AAE1G0T5_PETCI|nr:hypothetical protein Pcinc_012400 [Petrolisthes cinctipes]
MDTQSNNKLHHELESGVKYASAAKSKESIPSKCKEKVTDIEGHAGFVGEEMTGKEKEDIEKIIKAAGGNNVVSDSMILNVEIKEENDDYEEMDRYSDVVRNENGVDDKEESDDGKGDGKDSENEFACSEPDDIVMPDCIIDELSEEKKQEENPRRRKRPRRHHTRSHSSGNPVSGAGSHFLLGNSTSRTSPLSEAQRKTLVSLILETHPVIEDRSHNHKVYEKKQQAWDSLTVSFNTIFAQEPRTTHQLKRAWEHIKRKSKKGIQPVEGSGSGSHTYDNHTTATPSSTKTHLPLTEDGEDSLSITDKHANPFLDFTLEHAARLLSTSTVGSFHPTTPGPSSSCLPTTPTGASSTATFPLSTPPPPPPATTTAPACTNPNSAGSSSCGLPTQQHSVPSTTTSGPAHSSAPGILHSLLTPTSPSPHHSFDSTTSQHLSALTSSHPSMSHGAEKPGRKRPGMDEREKSYKRVRERQEEFHEEKLKLITESREMLNSVGNAVLEFLSVSTTAANSAITMFDEGRRTYRVMGETYKAIAESLGEHK